MKNMPSTPDMCNACPNRSKISRYIAKFIVNKDAEISCEGPITVSHGVIESRTRARNEPPINRADFSYNSSVTDSEGNVRYSRTNWTTINACGLDTLLCQEGEVPYSEQQSWENNGKRYAAFISGDEASIADHRTGLAMMALLDSVTEMQAAQANGSAEQAQDIATKINDLGFDIAATAGRDISKCQEN